jgi:hypothetical protein
VIATLLGILLAVPVPGPVTATQRTDLLPGPGLDTAALYRESSAPLCSPRHRGSWRVAVVAEDKRLSDRRLVRSMCGDSFARSRRARSPTAGMEMWP